MIKVATLMLALALSTTAQASVLPETVGVHIASHHLSDKQDWNNSNPGLYARWSNGVVVGSFFNSERKQSNYVGYVIESKQYKRLSGAIMFGAITGYSKRIQPMASVSGAFHVNESAAVRISFLPKAHANSSAVFHLTSEFKF